MITHEAYTYYLVEGEDFCIKSDLVPTFEADCIIRNLDYRKVARSNSVDSLRAFSSMKPVGFEHFQIGKN